MFLSELSRASVEPGLRSLLVLDPSGSRADPGFSCRTGLLRWRQRAYPTSSYSSGQVSRTNGNAFGEHVVLVEPPRD